MAKNLVFLRRQLYQLKREYGFPVAVYRTTPGATNLETGAKAVTRVRYQIDNAIVLPVGADTIAFYSAPLLKEGRQFAYGGYQDEDIKIFLIDACDVAIVILQSDTIVYKHQKFEIVKLQQVEDGAAYLLTAKFLKGEAPYEVHEASVFQSVRLIQRASNA